MTFQDQVREFHQRCGFHIGQFGAVPPLEVRRSRARLVWEEACELITELLADDPDYVRETYPAPVGYPDQEPRTVDPVKVAHEAADVHYVTSGASVNFGYDEDAVFGAVHRANMRKAYLADRPVGDEHGKARKPPEWAPPDITGAMRPYDQDLTNVEEAARWLARESRHPLYAGDGWQVLLWDASKVDHASRHAAGLATPGTSTQDIHNAAGVLRQHIRGRT